MSQSDGTVLPLREAIEKTIRENLRHDGLPVLTPGELADRIIALLPLTEQSEGAPLEITEALTKFGPGWRKVLAYYTDVLDAIRETVGPGYMVPRSVIDEMRGIFRAVIQHDIKQSKGPARDEIMDVLKRLGSVYAEYGYNEGERQANVVADYILQRVDATQLANREPKADAAI